MTTLTDHAVLPGASPPATTGECAHCGLPSPRGRFCCAGCAAVWEAIHGCGLEQYYAVRDGERGRTPRAAEVTDRRYGELDDPAFQTRFVTTHGGSVRSAELYLRGVHCGACVWLVERLPRIVDGVIEARLDIRRSTVRVTWDDERVKLSRVGRRLDTLGYPVRPVRGRSLRELRRAEDRAALVRLAVAGAIAVNVMVVAFALYGAMFHGMEPATFHMFRGTSLLLTAVAIAGPGRVFLRGAMSALASRTMHMDVPVALGITVGFGLSAVNTLRGTGDVYFESIAVLIFLLLVGRWVQQRRQRASADAIELLDALTPGVARVVENGAIREAAAIREVAMESLVPGDVVEVRHGDSIPADGTVADGHGDIDASLLTGEPNPVPVGPGDAVHAGTVCVGARLRITVQRIGEDTRAGRLMTLVERCAAERGAIVRLADRVAGRFVAAVLVLAAVTVAVWWPVDPQRAVTNGLALLIVTCPCALGLATPLAVMAAIGRAARRGILIKGGRVLEVLGDRRRGLVLLDKTGTLTAGRMRLASWTGSDTLRPVVVAIERHCAHPIAETLVAALAEDGVASPVVDDVRPVAGGGVTASWEGRAVLIGAPAFAAARDVTLPAWAASNIEQIADAAQTPVVIALDGVVEAVAALGDPLRDDAAQTIDALRRRGWRVGVISGDDPRAVRAVARTLGLDPACCRGGVTPEGKVVAVREAAETEPVVMVGDGVNDAAALAAATVGVAVRGGAEASLAAADVFLAGDGLRPLDTLFIGARRAMRVIRVNVAVSLLYNAGGVVLAMTGVINPLVAAVLMPISSLTVLTISARSRTFQERR